METLVHRNYFFGSMLLSPHWPAYMTNKNTWQCWHESGFLHSNFSWVPSPCCQQYSARSATKTKVKACYSCLPITLPMVLSQRQLRRKDYFSLGTNYCMRHLYLKIKKDMQDQGIYFHHHLFHTLGDSPKAGGICPAVIHSTAARESGVFAGKGWLEKCHDDAWFLLTEVKSVHRGSLLIKNIKSKHFGQMNVE